MSCSGRNADCFSAGDADFAKVIRRSDICDDSFDRFSSSRIRHETAATERGAGHTANDHRRHNDERYRRRVHIFERATIRQRLSIFVEQIQRSCRNVRAGAGVGSFLHDGCARFIARIGDDAEPIPWLTGICENIQRLSVVRCRSITGRLTKLTVCAVTVDRRTREEPYTAIIQLDYVIALDGAYCSHVSRQI